MYTIKSIFRASIFSTLSILASFNISSMCVDFSISCFISDFIFSSFLYSCLMVILFLWQIHFSVLTIGFSLLHQYHFYIPSLVLFLQGFRVLNLRQYHPWFHLTGDPTGVWSELLSRNFFDVFLSEITAFNADWCSIELKKKLYHLWHQ